jgi:hypothetical protein
MKDGEKKGRMQRKGTDRMGKKGGGKVFGDMPKPRMDKRARGGRMTPSSPFSGAGDTKGGLVAESESKDDGRASGGRLSAKGRDALPASDFALPGKGSGKNGKGSGSYPIENAAHARNALARVSQHGSAAEKAAVRAKVQAKYPEIGRD